MPAILGRKRIRMATRAQVQQLLDSGLDYEMAARELGIPAGEAYLTATGNPADGSDSRLFGDPRPLPASPQRLLGVPSRNPMRNPTVDAWVRERAARELTR
jgi:hypothetical protein